MTLALQSFDRLTHLTQSEALDLLARAHPMLVHFPIALLLAGALAELGRMLLGRPGRSPAGYYCVVLGTLGALLAGAAGWVLADIDPPSARHADTLSWHRWSAVAGTCLATIAFLVGLFARGESGARPARFYRLLLFVAAIAVALAGAKGGDLVWGEGHLFGGLEDDSDVTPVVAPASDGDESQSAVSAPEPQADIAEADSANGHSATTAGALQVATEPPPPSVVPHPGTGARVDFDRDVRPIFVANCIGCHGPKKSKGSLRLDRKGDLFEGDPSLWVIQPGDPENSLLYELVNLPEDDEERMPAEEAPLSAKDLAILRHWIAEGAKWGNDAAAPNNDVR